MKDKMSIERINVGGADHELGATYLVNSKNIDGISFNGTANVTRYAICSTASDSTAKIASILSGTFSLTTGARITIKFTYANSVANPTLNINNTGAKAIYFKGKAITSSQYWEAGSVIDLVYNGTQWEMVLDSKSHEHANKDIIDDITAAKISAWDAAEGNAKDYADDLNTTMDGRVATLEAWHNNFIEVSEEEINALFGK